MSVLQALVVFVGSYFFVYIFAKCFELEIISIRLIIAIIITQVIFYALILFPRLWLIKLLIILTIYSGIIYNKYEQLKNGFFLLENAIIERASDYYGFSAYRFIANRSSADKDITLLLIMIVIPVVGITSLTLLRGIGRVICYVILLIPVITSFAMGVTPPEVGLIAIIMVFLFLSISNGYYHDKSSLQKGSDSGHKSMVHRISIRSASILSLLVLMLFLLIKQFIPSEKYNDYNVVYETKTKIQTFMTDLSLRDISKTLNEVKWGIRPNRYEGSGGLSLGRLGEVDQITHDGTEHLNIKAPLQSVIEGIYLKGYVGSEYTGESWDIHSRERRKSYNQMLANISREDFEPAIGVSILLGNIPYIKYISQGRIEIEYDRANRNYAYAPYFTMFNENDMISFEYDLGFVSDKHNNKAVYDYSYNLSNYSFFNDSGLYTEKSNLKRYLKNEKIYRDFVYDTYTILPEKGLERLKHDFSPEEVGAASNNILDAIDYVKDYLDHNMRYTLSPGRLPKNKDFVEYFIYENKVGYCSHFASAGALMLRAMGYPARYVEGYAVNRSDLMNQMLSSYISDDKAMVDITVMDYHAHAWVEVYYDGFGWIPVEFTSGSGMEDMVDAVGEITQGSLEAIDDDGPQSPNLPPNPTELPELEPTPPESNPDEGIKDSERKDYDKSEKEYEWYIVVALLLVLLVGIFIYIILRLRDSRNLDTDDSCYSKKALRTYKAIERLFVLNGGLAKKSMSLEEYEEYVKEHLTLVPIDDFEACMDTVRKARFAREAISPSEYMSVNRFYSKLWNRTYESLSGIKRIYLKIMTKSTAKNIKY